MFLSLRLGPIKSQNSGKLSCPSLSCYARDVIKDLGFPFVSLNFTQSFFLTIQERMRGEGRGRVRGRGRGKDCVTSSEILIIFCMSFFFASNPSCLNATAVSRVLRLEFGSPAYCSCGEIEAVSKGCFGCCHESNGHEHRHLRQCCMHLQSNPRASERCCRRRMMMRN